MLGPTETDKLLETFENLLEHRFDFLSMISRKKDNIDLVVEDLTDILVTTAQQCAPQRKRKKSKCKSKGWNIDISNACRESKIMFHKWKAAGRPVDPGDQTYIEMKCKKKSTTPDSETARSQT